MSKIKINCCFCSWKGEFDNKFDFTCPTCGIDFGAIDDDGYQKANQVITEFIEKYQTGRTDFPAAEDISFACSKLQTLSGQSESVSSKRLFSLFYRKNGIHYSKVLPLIIEFQGSSSP